MKHERKAAAVRAKVEHVECSIEFHAAQKLPVHGGHEHMPCPIRIARIVINENVQTLDAINFEVIVSEQRARQQKLPPVIEMPDGSHAFDLAFDAHTGLKSVSAPLRTSAFISRPPSTRMTEVRISSGRI